MKKNEVKTGVVYSAKVSGNIVPVRIDKENPRGGWDGTNLVTKKSVRIKSAQKLRGKAARWPGMPDNLVILVKAGDPKKDAGDAKAANVGAGPKVGAKPAKDAKPAGKRATREPGATSHRTSGLDAAAKVLAEADGPLGCKEIVERALAKGYWKTIGKTPAATIYAAIIREIAAKGDKSCFRKTDRGHFELTPAGIAARTAAARLSPPKSGKGVA